MLCSRHLIIFRDMQPTELQQQIRFSISQLSALNGQADFEKICLHFSRARIHKNILPATGPVQAGGDQGRDFETFHTYLSKTPEASSFFVGAFSEYAVGFACSLQKHPTKKKGKIFSDVKTIISTGTKVERIYFFSGEDIPVAYRHKCQKEIKDEFKVELDIIDAQALSLHLTDADLFWIAIQYLKVPSEAFPKREDKDWYTDILREYQNRSNLPDTFEEFSDIKTAIRRIYKDKDFKADLLFWLPKLDEIIDKSPLPNFLKRKATYEKFVASLIGLDNIDGQEQNIEKYFADFDKYTSPADLEDSQVLLSFCYNSLYMGRHHLPKEFLDTIANRLEALLIKRLKSVENIDTRCTLIEIHASFLFHDQRNGRDYPLNMGNYVRKLSELLPLLGDSQFFPIGHFLDRLNEILRIFSNISVDIEDLEKFIAKIDIIFEKKGGGEVLANKLRERADSYLESKQYFKALQTLHELKIKWYNFETFKGSIISCLLIAHSYHKLNLFFASKYYALVAAYLSLSPKKIYHELYLEGISVACDCEYLTGSWMQFLNLTDLHAISHFRMTKDFDIYKHEDMHKLLYYPAIVLECSHSFLPEVTEDIENTISKWGFMKDDIEELRVKIKENFNTGDKQIILEEIRKQLFGVPFNDAGKIRHITFNASGCDFHFSFENKFELNGIAEEFICSLQILLADLFHEDLYLIPGKIKAELVLGRGSQPNFDTIPSNEETTWRIELVPFKGKNLEELRKHEFHYLVIAQAILYEVSLLPDIEYRAIVEKKLIQENLTSKLSFGRPYEDLYQQHAKESKSSKQKKSLFIDNPTEDLLKPIVNNKLPWKSGVAKKYNPAQVSIDIGNRIASLKTTLSVTLPKLKKDKNFLSTVKQLKDDGWLDWQILHAVGMIVFNFKARFTHATKPSIEKIQELYHRNEKDWYEDIPLGVLSIERLKRELETLFVTTMLPSLGLQNHSETPNGKAITTLLKERFNFFEDGKDCKIF